MPVSSEGEELVQVSGAVEATLPDGADIAIGSRADPSTIVTDTTPATLIGLIKGLLYLMSHPLSASITNFPASQSISNFPASQRMTSQDGDQASVGATTDASTATSIIGLLKAIKASVAGIIGISVADGSDVALGAKADVAAASDTGTSSLISMFKRLLATKLMSPAQDANTAANVAGVAEL